MLELSLLNVSAFFLFLIIFFITYTVYLNIRPSNEPPQIGIRLPLLGHALCLSSDFAKAKGLVQFKEKHGPIVQVYFGWQPMIFVNDYEIAKEMLVKHGSYFVDRPRGWFNGELMQGRGILPANGPSWQQHRRFALQVLRDFGMGKTILEDNINVEVRRLEDAIAATNGADFDIKVWLPQVITNVIGALIDGKTYEFGHATIKARQKYIDDLMNMNLFADAFAFVERIPYFDPLGQKWIRRVQNKVFDVYRKEVAEHREKLDPDNVRDFIDAYLVEMDRLKDDPSSYLSEEELYQTLDDLYLAGTLTTATTMHWAILLVASHPEVQDRIRAEIHEAIGLEQMPSTRHRSLIPFTEATIQEILRFSSGGQIADKDVDVGGYHFPKGSIILMIIYNVMRDEKYFPDAYKFRPERFLEDGKPIKSEHNIPFSIGKRSCPGESLARMELYLFFVRLVQRFRFTFDPEKPAPSLEPKDSLLHEPCDYLVRAERITA